MAKIDSYENIGAFVRKLFRRRKADAAVPAGNEGDFSFELTHGFLLGGHLFAVLRARFLDRDVDLRPAAARFGADDGGSSIAPYLRRVRGPAAGPGASV